MKKKVVLANDDNIISDEIEIFETFHEFFKKDMQNLKISTISQIKHNIWSTEQIPKCLNIITIRNEVSNIDYDIFEFETKNKSFN